MPRFPLAAVAVAVACALAAGARSQPDDDPPAETDADVLKAVGLNPADGAGLVGYLKVRTATDVDRGKLDELVRRFAADKFEDRLAAAAAAERLGPVAISPLRALAEDKKGDPEVAYRAGLVLKKLQKVDHAKVAAAAVRGVAKGRPPGAAAALLGFLPLADTDAVADDVRTALVALAVSGGKADPALVAGLADPSPVRRAACYVALVEGGPADKRVRVPDAFDKVKAAVRGDADPEARFRGLWTLAHTTREKEFVPDLIAAIPTLPRGRLWQVEDFLLRLSGDYPPDGRFGRTPEQLAAARDAWAGWWAKNPVDLAKADLTPRVRGLTDLVLQDPGYGKWAVLTLGPDLKEAWRLGGNPQTMHAFDARMLPGGTVLLAEQNYNRVSERDAAGNVVRQYGANNAADVVQPVAAEVLPNGNWLVFGRSRVGEVKPGEKAANGHTVRAYTRPKMPPMLNGYDIVTGKRMANGEVVILTQNAQGPNCHRLDEKLEPVGAGLTLPRFQGVAMAGIDFTADGKVLVCHTNQVVEYDLKDGKAGWSYDVGFATSVQRLANGNTLIASVNTNRAVEVSPARDVVWEYHAPDGMNVARIARR